MSGLSLVKFVVPSVVGACIGATVMMALGRIMAEPETKKETINETVEEQELMQQPDDECGNDYDENNEEDPHNYIAVLGVQMDVDYDPAQLPVYWTYAFMALCDVWRKINPRYLLSVWCGCGKVALQVADDGQMNRLAERCTDHEILYVIIDGRGATGDDPVQPRMKIIAIGPCLRRDFEEFNPII